MTDFPIHTAGPAFEEPWSKKDVDEAFAQLRFSTVRLDAILRDNNLALVELAELLLEIRQHKQALRALEDLCQNQLGTAMTENMLILDGVGRVKRNKRKDVSKWERTDKEEDDRVLPLVLSAVLNAEPLKTVDPETGEVHEETDLEKVLACFHLDDPRTKQLEKRGIKKDDWITTEYKSGYTIQVTSPDELLAEAEALEQKTKGVG